MFLFSRVFNYRLIGFILLATLGLETAVKMGASVLIFL